MAEMGKEWINRIQTTVQTLRKQLLATRDSKLDKWDKMVNETLKFYDLKGKKSFTTNKYTTTTKNNTKFAIAQAPSGIKSYRILHRGKKKGKG